MKNRGLGSLVLIILGALFIIGTILIFTNTNKKTSSSPDQATITQASSPTIDEKDRLLKTFLDYNYSKYPYLQSQVSRDQIKNVFPLSLRSEGAQFQQGWIVEASTKSGFIENKYFLLTSTLDKELTDATSTVNDDKSGSCILDNVRTIYSDKTEYLILSSKQCSGFGTANTGSISIYKLLSGEKIKFQTFSLPYESTSKAGVSKTGNALGIFKDIYGENQPTIAIDYYSSQNVALTAYFDLKTGKLNQIIEFK